MSSNVSISLSNKTETSERKVRESNIELLRILTICGVVILHYNGTQAFSFVNENSLNYYFLLILEGLCICAVNLFVLISGYFLSTNGKRRIIKAVELIVQVMVINLGVYLFSSVVSGGGITVSGTLYSLIPNNYFVAFYVTLYLISPYINILLSHLSDKQFGIFVGLSLLLFSFWPTFIDSVCLKSGVAYPGIYTTNTAGSQYGYSIINFALMYLIGAYLKRKNFDFSLSKLITVLVALVAVLTVWQLLQPQIARAYCNPLVICCAVVIFLIFKGIKVKSKIINTLAKGAFTCFLLHGMFLPHIRIASVVNKNLFILILHISLTVPLIFLICFCCWWVYNKATAPIFKMLGKKLAFIDSIISLQE